MWYIHIRAKFDQIFKNTGRRAKDQTILCGRTTSENAQFFTVRPKRPNSKTWLKVCGCEAGAGKISQIPTCPAGWWWQILICRYLALNNCLHKSNSFQPTLSLKSDPQSKSDPLFRNLPPCDFSCNVKWSLYCMCKEHNFIFNCSEMMFLQHTKSLLPYCSYVPLETETTRTHCFIRCLANAVFSTSIGALHSFR